MFLSISISLDLSLPSFMNYKHWEAYASPVNTWRFCNIFVFSKNLYCNCFMLFALPITFLIIYVCYSRHMYRSWCTLILNILNIKSMERLFLVPSPFLSLLCTKNLFLILCTGTWTWEKNWKCLLWCTQATSAGLKDQEAINFLEKKMKSDPSFTYEETVQVAFLLSF